ncbi:MAG: 16S rRNA (cytosine(1402)-N(4))-methyltransferase RsmH [Actinomycetota bacterium]
MSNEHIPVALTRTVELLTPALTGHSPLLIDATLGLGGHTEYLLEKFETLHVLGIDRDKSALEKAGARLSRFGSRVTMVHAVYDHIEEVARNQGIESVQGILFDLGVSSMQLDSSDRGFAYSHDAPLDMRMDQSVGISAGEVVNTYSHQELTRILREYGEEKFASRIAAKIIDARTVAPLSSTVVLANIVKESIPAATRRVGGNPAKRTFQALRIYVNNELEVLERAIPAALNLLATQGRMVVLSYHSLEDRIVKRAFTKVSSSEVPHGLPVEPKPARFQLLTRASEGASEAEISMNPRSQSVRIRAIERRAA